MAENSDGHSFLTVTTPSKVKFLVLALEGSESLSDLFHYRLTLASTDGAVDGTQLLGQDVTIGITLHSGKKRWINGIVTRFIQGATDYQHTTYILEVAPWLWLLTQIRNCKIFQNMNVMDILSAVFRDIPNARFDDQTTAVYQEKEYCVQYRESDFDFISRLMEENGIYYFFEHAYGEHILVLVDDNAKHASCPHLTKARLRQNNKAYEDLIDHCTLELCITSSSFSTTDYNFETPNTSLVAKAQTSQQPELRIYDYPGLYQKIADGDSIAKLRLQAELLPAKLLRGESSYRAFIAGYELTLADHVRADLNSNYILSHLVIRATQDSYKNAFTAFPKGVQFRPRQTTPKPVIHGVQTAVVVGMNGEEIWTDSYGRIKVQFHWDEEGKKDEYSSCWIRVSQVWVGKGWGTLFTPRIGTEVIVSFLEGDPDRPMIIGAVYNGEQTVPYPLNNKQTTSTILSRSSKAGQAGNELRFDDTKNAEEVYIRAQKDMNVLIEDKETRTVKATRDLTVEGNENHTNQSAFNRTVAGDYTLNVDGNLDIRVNGGITINGSQNISIQANATMTNKAALIKLN